MGKPAARVGDMHVCPMVTPGVPPIPHVGGPIMPPGKPNVMIGGVFAATMGSMCVCTGPPDSIILGSMGVMIGKQPAARMGDMTAHGGSIVVGLPTVMIGEMGPGAASIPPVILPVLIAMLIDAINNPPNPLANPKVQELVLKSPTLANNLVSLQSKGWVIKYGVPGKGTFADRTKSEIVLDPNNTDGVQMTQSLAHESGHAMYTPDPYVPPGKLSKADYASKNANSGLKDEGEATLTNAQVRNEINTNGGDDIGIAGSKSDDYQKAYENYEVNGDREKSRQEIADIFADGDHPSTAPGQTYREYYSQPYNDYYDKNVKP